MEEVKVELTPAAEENAQETIACLIEAASEISKASDEDFQAMKDKTWYKRLWELVTFSKDSEKKLASGVANLAKLQEIVMKALLLLSNKSAEISDVLAEHEGEIARLAQGQKSLAKTQVALIQEIERLKSGVKKELTLNDLSDDEKTIVISVLANVGEHLDLSTDASKDYFNRVKSITGYPQDDIDVEYIEETFTGKKANLLYRILMEYTYLATGAFDLEDDALESISVSGKYKRQVTAMIERIAQLGGERAIIETYDEVDYNYLADDGIEWYEEATAEEDNTEQLAEDYADFDPAELEDLTISSITKISREEDVSFVRKKIRLNSSVVCEGSLTLDSCTII